MTLAASKSALKRKFSAKKRVAARKRARVEVLTAEHLPWKTVSRATDTIVDGDDGILELEEVDDVEVVYEDTPAGRVAKFNVRAHSSCLECNPHADEVRSSQKTQA